MRCKVVSTFSQLRYLCRRSDVIAALVSDTEVYKNRQNQLAKIPLIMNLHPEWTLVPFD